MTESRSALLAQLLLLFSTILLWPDTTIALDLKQMLSPGALITPHADLEGGCDSCHMDFDRAQQNQLCLDCHEKVAADITQKRGFHGKKPGVTDSECRLCHSEHKGANADIVQLNPHGFNHQFTDFPLKGKHTKTECKACHQQNSRHRETPSQCIDCHRKQDVHQGKQGKACDNCHTSTAWRETQFDHNQTDFPLSGAHESVSCHQCHRDTSYLNTPTQCAACHQIDDAHAGQFGSECKQCHVTESWDKTDFDHNRDTDFSLIGAHKDLSCVACHHPKSPDVDPEARCVSCHRSDDVHVGDNGDDCAQCHDNTRWRNQLFNHDKTTFPLLGAHQDARCEQCHQGDIHKAIDASACRNCHQNDDAHNNSLSSDCKNCHGNTAWPTPIRFDHDLTAFPLLGAHAITACEQCHQSFAFIGQSRECHACHQADDPHQSALGSDCAQCHTSLGWLNWHFDHSKQTEFPLTGAHENLACEGCHNRTMSAAETNRECGFCHGRDDIHRGAYGMDCQRCHDTRDFSRLKMR